MSSSEEFQILSEFRKFHVVPHRSNNRFRGHVFASIAMEHIKKHVPLEKYATVLGPVWIKSLERVEWDGIIIKKDSKEVFPHYYNSSDIIAIFEFKVGGIYGVKKPQKGKKTVRQVIEEIKANFDDARNSCKNLLGCFYISLHERKPDESKRKPINYYAETKAILTDTTTCILFNSKSFEKEPKVIDCWNDIIGRKLDALLR